MDLLLSYLGNSVRVFKGGNGGDEGYCRRLCGKEGQMGGSIVRGDWLEVVEV